MRRARPPTTVSSSEASCQLVPVHGEQGPDRGAQRRDGKARRLRLPEYLMEEQRSQPGCPAREVVLDQRGQATTLLAARVDARAQLAWLSLAMFLGMTMWFSATAANAPIVAEFHLSPSQTAWLTMAVQGGFVVGTLISAVLNLPDIINPRRLFAVGCVLGAAANAALVRSDSAAMLIALRAATGASLAWVYPPGMKVAAGWFEKR